MTLKRYSFFDSVFIVVLIAFLCGPVSFVRSVGLNVTSGGIIIAFLFLYLLLRGELKFFKKNIYFSLALFGYLFWCMLTVLWSEFPLFSLVKSVSFFISVTTMLMAGSLWTRSHLWPKTLNFLLPIAIITLLAGVLGFHTEGTTLMIGKLSAYYGLLADPNMFGCLTALIFPFILWQLYNHWAVLLERSIYSALLLLDIYFLLSSYSRSAALVVIIISFLFLMSFNVKGKVKIGVSILTLSMILLVFFSDSVEQAVEARYLKNSPDVFSSRIHVWQDSYEGALQGGMFGGGYNMALEKKNGEYRDILLMSSHYSIYSREKSNSFYALIEETGLVGLSLFLLVIVHVSFKAFTCWQDLTQQKKVLLGILMGAFLGILVQSFFEAWWVGPASPENIYFWTLTGAILELMRTFKQERLHALT